MRKATRTIDKVRLDQHVSRFCLGRDIYNEPSFEAMFSAPYPLSVRNFLCPQKSAGHVIQIALELRCFDGAKD